MLRGYNERGFNDNFALNRPAIKDPFIITPHFSHSVAAVVAYGLWSLVHFSAMRKVQGTTLQPISFDALLYGYHLDGIG